MAMEAQESPQAEAAAVDPNAAQLATRPREWPIEVRANGTILFDGIAIGGLSLTDTDVEGKGCPECEFPRLTLNAGWIRLAGLRFRVQDDPERDSHRDGLVLDR